LGIFNKLFNRSSASSRNQANQRLQVVLAKDRCAANTETLQLISQDVARVVRKHLDIAGEPQIHLLRQGRHTVIDINIIVKAR